MSVILLRYLRLYLHLSHPHSPLHVRNQCVHALFLCPFHRACYRQQSARLQMQAWMQAKQIEFDSLEA